MPNRVRASYVLLASLLIAGILHADNAKDAKPGQPVAATGIFTEVKPDYAMIWIDGEDEPAKFTVDPSCDKSMVGKFVPTGIFSPDRVQITYVNTDDGRKLMSLRREKPLLKGAITGTVLFTDNKFWIAVKPADGPPDGFAINWPIPPDTLAKLKALQKGDIVAIRFHTDSERHRMDSLDVKPPAPAALPKPAPATQPQSAAAPLASPANSLAAPVVMPPTTAPSVAATTQPAQTPEAEAHAKLKYAQIYIDNNYKDQAKTALHEIVNQFPNTDAAKDAQAKLKQLGD